MGRSVSHPAGAVVAFRLLDDDGEDGQQNCSCALRLKLHPYAQCLF